VHLGKVGPKSAGRDAELDPTGKPTFSFDDHQLAAMMFSFCARTDRGSLDASWQRSGLRDDASLETP
jgi:hypothetical protein